MNTLFHVTTSEVAALILRDGFQGGHGCYMTATEHQGVWLSDHEVDVLDPNECAWGDTVLTVKFAIPLAALADYEWIEERKGYREWLVPARLIQAHATVSMAEELPQPRSRHWPRPARHAVLCFRMSPSVAPA